MHSLISKKDAVQYYTKSERKEVKRKYVTGDCQACEFEYKNLKKNLQKKNFQILFFRSRHPLLLYMFFFFSPILPYCSAPIFLLLLLVYRICIFCGLSLFVALIDSLAHTLYKIDELRIEW